MGVTPIYDGDAFFFFDLIPSSQSHDTSAIVH
jgi:hypothetical protein